MPPGSENRLPRMLVCDLDGTLLDGLGAMTETTKDALLQAIAAGIEPVFATGRRHSFACKVLGTAMFDQRTLLISSNGAITGTLGGERRHRTGMPVETALLLASRLKEFRDSLVFTFDRIGHGALVVEDIPALHRRLPRWVDANLEEIAEYAPLERAFDRGEEPVQAMICGRLAEMRQGLAVLESAAPEAVELRRRIAIHRTEYPARDLAIVDLMANGCSKGLAVARLAEQRGIRPAEIAAIGDNMNDADMLALAGTAIVMGNAPAELLDLARENGWRITGGNDEDGAARAILRMLEEFPARLPAVGDGLGTPEIEGACGDG